MVIIRRRKLNFCGICVASYLKLLLIYSILPVNCYSINSDSLESNQIQHNKLTGQQIVSVHSLDYGWRPVGHGDPLKNDPTFDYSPPTRDRVRYWAETNNSSDKELKIHNNRNNNKFPQPFTVADRIGNLGSLRKDVKAVQPFVSGFSRRPMFGQAENNNNIKNNNIIEDIPLLQPKFSGIRRSYYANDLSMHLMPPPMIPSTPKYYDDIKFKNSNEYVPKMPYYSTDSSIILSKPNIAPNIQQLKHDNSIITTQRNSQYYPSQPTHYRPVGNMLQRKAWLHELLQKEIVVQPSNSLNISAINQTSLNFVPSLNPKLENLKVPETVSEKPINPPITRTTTTTTTAQPIIKPSPSPTPTPTIPPTALPTPSTTVAHKSEIFLRPVNMTNNKHADFRLAGPMYLIIEGHSKVKTYGQNEYDPSKPKIVPIIPKREPVAVMSNSIDNLKTINKYPVKHLHTKTTSKATTPVPTKQIKNLTATETVSTNASSLITDNNNITNSNKPTKEQ